MQEVVTNNKIQGEELSFNSILKVGFIKLVKLNFTSISIFSFHMIHCVPIGEKLHLYLYGDHVCYTSWQYAILFAVLPIVVLFPLTFAMALNLLKEEVISTKSFLAAAVIPYYTCFLYLKKRLTGLQHHRGSKEDKKCADAILDTTCSISRRSGAEASGSR